MNLGSRHQGTWTTHLTMYNQWGLNNLHWGMTDKPKNAWKKITCIRNCFLVKNGLSCCNFKESTQDAWSDTMTFLLTPFPAPLCLFLATSLRRSSSDMFSHSWIRLADWYQLRKDLLELWHFLQRLVEDRAPQVMLSFTVVISSQSTHLSSEC
jgi:hypothetical protein